MGCTPSIHVSQTGVVYCRESDDSTSSRPSAYSTSAFHTTTTATHNPLVLRDGAENSSINPSSPLLPNKPATGQNKANGRRGEDRNRSAFPVTVSGPDPLACDDRSHKDKEEDFGIMRIPQKPLTMLLVFSKGDQQSESLWQAAERLGHSCSLALTPTTALDSFLHHRHDLVFIDRRRSSLSWDPDTLCRSLRDSVKNNNYSVIVAVCKQSPSDKEEPSILPLLKAGFNRRFTETTNVGTCMNELQQLFYSEVRTLRKLRACDALVTALEHVSDAVEITNDSHVIQYVNPGYERITGFKKEELLGKDCRELCRADRTKDLTEHTAVLKKEKYWEGMQYTRKKNGESVPHHCRMARVEGPEGRISQYVCIKSVSPDTFTQIANGGVYGVSRRRDSVGKVNSTMIEAPITKVINMISTAQESSSVTVAQALEKVLDILRTSELYAPHLPPMLARDDDPMTSDLVGGLVSQYMKRRMSNHEVQPHRASQHHLHQHTSTPPGSLAQVPQPVRDILDTEPSWNFDIIQLEEATHKRPLVYLGLKIFARFEVCQFLGIPESVLVLWLQLIEESYHSTNPYHNSTHAADVLHASAYFLECDRTKMVLEPADCVACLIAATVHDVDHPGRTNAFLVNASNPLALLYNDLGVLESHHASLAFRLTHKDSSVNIFGNLSREDYRSMRVAIIDMVMATEMKQHFEHLSKFINSINKSVLKFDTDSSSDLEGTGMSGSSFDSDGMLSQLSTPENRVLIKRMLIKCADVSNPARPWKLCETWAQRIAEEYCSQTDEEKEQGLPVVMPVFDRKTCSIPKSQTSFIDVFISNMFEAWDYYCHIPDLINQLQYNYRVWKELEDKPKDITPSNSMEEIPGPTS